MFLTFCIVSKKSIVWIKNSSGNKIPKVGLVIQDNGKQFPLSSMDIHLCRPIILKLYPGIHEPKSWSARATRYEEILRRTGRGPRKLFLSRTDVDREVCGPGGLWIPDFISFRFINHFRFKLRNFQILHRRNCHFSEIPVSQKSEFPKKVIESVLVSRFRSVVPDRFWSVHPHSC